MSGAIKRLLPLFDRILIQKAEQVTKTAGGIVIPEKSAEKVLRGIVVAVGPGARNEAGNHIAPQVKVGDHVLLPEYGGTKVTLSDDKEMHLYRESDILAKIDS